LERTGFRAHVSAATLKSWRQIAGPARRARIPRSRERGHIEVSVGLEHGGGGLHGIPRSRERGHIEVGRT